MHSEESDVGMAEPGEKRDNGPQVQKDVVASENAQESEKKEAFGTPYDDVF